jgi:hypothetical protein
MTIGHGRPLKPYQFFIPLVPAVPLAAPVTGAPSLFQPSYRLPEVEGEYPRTNHQVYFQIARPVPVTGMVPYELPPAVALVSEDTTYAASRRDFPALLFWRTPTAQIAPKLFVPPSRPLEGEGEYSRANHQVYFQVARAAPAAPTRPLALLTPAPLSWVLFQDTFSSVYSQPEPFSPGMPVAPTAAPNLFTLSYRPPEVEPGYSRTDHQLYFLVARQPAVAVVVAPAAPPAGGGLLPGRPPPLAKGMGPYKRKDQVFGEPDPVSPHLTSRAPEALVDPTYALPTLPSWDNKGADAVPTLHYELQVLMFVAVDELCASPGDLLRGPLRLRIIRH